jgi:hypothetical protein
LTGLFLQYDIGMEESNQVGSSKVILLEGRMLEIHLGLSGLNQSNFEECGTTINKFSLLLGYQLLSAESFEGYLS